MIKESNQSIWLNMSKEKISPAKDWEDWTLWRLFHSKHELGGYWESRQKGKYREMGLLENNIYR